MLRKVSKMNLSVAVNAATFANKTVIPKKEDHVKCLRSFVGTAELRHKYLSNLHLIVQYTAVSAISIIAQLAININLKH
ncbi:hypothetical protein SAMN05443529_103241 [Desulfosporosinus hippei DSM 8344]|uniref:Uncharacterized protein n=1 Tax=Desulfosporosinus hippei DSM 8344 TaxID=1121419 RepID=A0A1G7UT57_9FIRM|nr:hypothetical protein SAMN05443529_103241 [Desulfosporosinus hippei DSM 8344]